VQYLDFLPQTGYSKGVETKVRDFIKQFHMLEPHEHVIVGVSGGADSVCLLFLLYDLCGTLDLRLSVVHVNHQIRESAKRDELFVKKLCEDLDLAFYAVSADVEAFAKKEGLTVEEAGRIVRFNAFGEKKKELSADKIALAHHKTDQAETVLFHLSRGCGLDGLVGIRPVRGDIIHPLLCVNRAEIEAFLQRRQITYVTDETNEELVYRRNIMRHEILPVLEQKICKGSVEHIAKTAEICLEASDFLANETLRQCREHLRYQNGQNGDILILDSVLQIHPYLQKTVIHRALAQLAGSRKDIGAVHIGQVLGLFGLKTGRRRNLVYGMLAERTYDGVRLYLPEAHKKENVLEPLEFDPHGIDEAGQEFCMKSGSILAVRTFPYKKTSVIEQKTYTKWFDYDKINGHLTVRTRKSGDFFYIDDTGRQTVKAYMINHKIPRDRRDDILLITQKDHVLWMTGYRISSYFKVTQDTQRILEITISGGKTDGREDQCTYFRRGC